MTTKTYTRPFTRAELVQMASDYVAAGGRDASIETAQQLVDAACDSMDGRIETEMTGEGESIDVPNERIVEDGDYEIVREALAEAIAATDEFRAEWEQSFLNTSAPDPTRFRPLGSDEADEIIDELTEKLADYASEPDGGAKARMILGCAKQARVDLDAGKSVWIATDEDGTWFLSR